MNLTDAITEMRHAARMENEEPIIRMPRVMLEVLLDCIEKDTSITGYDLRTNHGFMFAGISFDAYPYRMPMGGQMPIDGAGWAEAAFT